MHYVFENHVHLVLMDVHAPRRNLSGCRILHILKIQTLDVSVQVQVDHTSGDALLEELVNSHS